MSTNLLTLHTNLRVRKLFLLAIVGFACMSSHSRSENFEQIDEKPGYQRLRISNAEYEKIFAEQVEKPANALQGKYAQKQQITRTREVVVVRSLDGALNSGLPPMVVKEILEENGYNNRSSIPLERQNVPIDIQVIDIDAMKTSFSSGAHTLGGCKKRWRQKTRREAFSIDRNNPIDLAPTGPNVQSNVDGYYIGQGSVAVEINYSLKRWECPFGVNLPYYKARFDKGVIKADAYVNGGINITGYATAAYENTLFNHRINLWSASEDYYFYIFEFDLNLDWTVDLGVKLNASAAASFSGHYKVTGDAGLTWTCTSQNCTKTRNDLNLSPIDDGNVGAAVEVNVQLTPYIDTRFSADLDMYYGAIEIAEADLGIVAALPIRLYAYYGNLCSDADGNGDNELISTQLLDVTLQVFAYLQYEILGNSQLNVFDFNISGFESRLSEELYTLAGSGDISEKSIKFIDFSSGSESSIFEPVSRIVNNADEHQVVSLSKRSCYPFHNDLKVEIDWQDGNANYIGASGTIEHPYDSVALPIRTRVVGDTLGRDFDGGWITINSIYNETNYNFMPVIIDLILSD